MKFLGWLFHRKESSTVLEVVLWWEARRLVFNVFIGVSGIGFLVLLGCMEAAGLFGPELDLEPISILIAGFLFILAANLCYTGGWFLELTMRGTVPTHQGFAPRLLKIGFMISGFIMCLFGLAFIALMFATRSIGHTAGIG